MDNLNAYSDIQLLALLLAGEADNQPLAGQVAVACVVMERLRLGRWGATVRTVMLQPWQFSTFNDTHWMRFTHRMHAHTHTAALAIGGLLKTPAPGATHYHADYIAPNWATSPQMQRVATVGNHLFYREF